MKSARVAVSLAALALFAGCSTPPGGTAFVVDGTPVSLEQVDASAKGCASLVEQDSSLIEGEVARMLLAGELADALEEQTKVVVTPAMRGAALKKLEGQPLLADEACGTAVTGFANYAAITEKLGQQKLAAALPTIDVEVNPRFGAWDAARGTFTGGSGSLSMADVSQGKVLG